MKKLILLGFLITSAAFAQDDRAPAAVTPSEGATKTNEKAQKRQYPGGRDEQDLKVQASLPQTTRSLDGVVPGEVAVPDDHD